MNLEEVPKKIQYITVDSYYVNGSNNAFSVDFNFDSNVFVEEMRDVIGIKIVDFYVTQVGVNSTGTLNAAKYLDVICKDIPTNGQLLDERKGQVLAKIPIERNFEGSASLVVHDKQWKNWIRHTNYFNPISIKKLNFEIYELTGAGKYETLQPDAQFYFILEITTIDRKAPPKDTNLRVIKAINKLCAKVDNLNENIQKIPPPPEPKKKIPLRHVMFFFMAIAGIIFFALKQKKNIQE
jgi:hypothetical protein